jgi:hypothetical protein
MTEGDLKELKRRLGLASEREIGRIFDSLGEMSPFEDPGNKLLLKSVVRQKAIERIEGYIRSGLLKVEPSHMNNQN